VITGHATAAGTAQLAERFSKIFFPPLGQTGLRVSQAGFGGYRISAGVPAHGAALRRALQSGVNLIDTSANYADGRSEELIGEVVAQLIADDRRRREELVLVSKAGYLQGRNYEISQQRKRQGSPFPELVPYADGLEHCIHPDFLQDQLGRSLQRLGLESIDVYLLHNPEYFLGWAAKQGQPAGQAQTEYLRRIEAAFRHLETEVARGRIRFYGISSNMFPVAGDDPQFTCLERIWQTAVSISADHHFRVIQLPMNLFETGAVLLANQPSGETTLALARKKGLGVLVNRPLNAVAGNRLVRLAEVAESSREPAEEVRRRIAELRAVEEAFARQILPQMDVEPGIRSRLEAQLRVADALEGSWQSLQGYDHWRQIRDDILLPRIRGVWAHLEANPAAGRPAAAWQKSSREKLEAVVQAIGGIYAEEARQKVGRIKTLLAQADPDWAAESSLSRLVLRALRSTAEISCVLMGMRREKYVEDVVGELQTPVPIVDRKHAWRRLATSITNLT
jgi:aryl-alcohol dehydrogenase-like predicted oxidoreductase